MHPVLFEIGSYQVPAYGVALLISFVVGLWVAKRRADARGLDGENIIDVGMVIIVSSILGARLLYVFTHLEEFRPPRGVWTDAINPLQSSGGVGIVGLSLMGGLVLAMIAAFVFFRRRNLEVLAYTDIMFPSVGLGEGFTRIGCYLNGCCFGKICSLPWGVHFPAGSGPYSIYGDQALHPTQLYASLMGFAIFGLLVWLHRRPRPDGWILSWFLILAPGSRVYFDFLRWYEPEVIVAEIAGAAITVNQVICLPLIAAGIVGLVVLRGRPGRSSQNVHEASLEIEGDVDHPG